MNQIESTSNQKPYLHGFTEQEQDRLYAQAGLLERTVHDQVDFSGRNRILEVGSGVGAQAKILLRRFPGAFVQGIDASSEQLDRARLNLKEELSQGRVALALEDAARLSFPDASFDGVFTSWLFEHVGNPLDILREIRRVLSPGGVFYGIEVMNSSFHLDPHCPALMEYWEAYNRLQKDIGGDPLVGAKMGNYLAASGFAEIRLTPFSHHFDQRDPALFSKKIDYWEGLLLSAAPTLTSSGRIREGLIAEMKKELLAARTHPQGVFYCTPIKFRAVKA